MSQSSKKKILVTTEFVNSAGGAFFKEIGFDLETKYREGDQYLFAVDGASSSIEGLPRLQTKKDIDAKFLNSVRSYISEEYFTTDAGRELLAAYFSASSDFDLIDRYSKEFKNIYNVKIHEYLNVGFFVDSVVVEAYKAGFDINALRNYLHHVLGFAFKKIELSSERMPIELSYSHDGEAFSVQVTLKTDYFNGKNEFEETLPLIMNSCQFFDVSYFTKRNQLSISCLIFKTKFCSKSRAYFFTEIAKKSLAHESDHEIHSGLKDQENVRYEAPILDDEQSKKLTLVRKFALFIKNYRKNEEEAKPSDELEIEDIERYLSFYPKQDSVKELNDELKQFIVRLVKDESLFEGITDYIQKISSSNLDDQIQEIQRVLSEKSLSDIEEILLIRGQKKVEEGVSVVKGWIELSDDEATIVSGPEYEAVSNEKWAVKKGQIKEKLQNEVIRIKGSGRNVIESDIIRVMSRELNVDENDVKTVVSGIVEEVVAQEVIKNQNLEAALAAKILGGPSPEEIREKLESQVTRMKKVIEQMKKEIIKFQNEKMLRGIEGNLNQNTEGPEIHKLKFALSKAMELAKAKDKIIEKQKSDSEINLKSRDHKIEVLENRIEEIKAEHARSREFANEEKLQILEAENKTLRGRLELANKKMNIISENIENKSVEVSEKHSKELESLKGNMQVAQSVIERFKEEKLEMETKLQENREIIRKLKEDASSEGSNGALKSELAEKENQIQLLQSERRSLDEKYRLQTMELKKVEQKLKFTTSQLESSNKRGGSGQKSADAYAKQLEQANARLGDANHEVAEKRKEIVKLKQENTLMSSKIAELEKKLGLAKKAS